MMRKLGATESDGEGEGDDEGGGGDAEPLSEWETTVRTLRAVTKSSV